MKERHAFLSLLKRLDLLTPEFDSKVVLSSARFDLSTLLAAGALVCSEQQALQVISKDLHLPLVPLSDKNFLANCQCAELAGLMRDDFCLDNQVLPIKKSKNGYEVVFANPMHIEALKSLEFVLQSPVIMALAAAAEIENLLKRYYYFATKSPEASGELHSTPGSNVEVLGKVDAEHEIDPAAADSAPVISLVNKIIADAIEQGASDIHYEPTENGLDVRFRIDGVMIHAVEFDRGLRSHVLSRLKLLAGMDIAEKRKPQNGRLRVKSDGDAIDIRASSIPAAFGEKIVLRLLHSAMKGKSFEDLEMPAAIANEMRGQLDRRGRIILVTGPTGSGKTTSLYTALDYLNDGRTNIQTVEDPIEYRVAGISQVQVNEMVNVNFASALRSFLRQDPDVIMVGEIRDSETAEIAMRAAQTGHLVLSTLHTNSAPEAITRLRDLGVPSFVLASGLGAIVAQRLVRKLCPACARAMSAENTQRWQEQLTRYSLESGKLREAVGCRSCNGTGYKGRQAIYSYLEITPEISEMVQNNAPLSHIIEEARGQGYSSLEEVAVAMVGEGDTTFDEVIPYLEKNAVRKSPRREVAVGQSVKTPHAVAKESLSKPLVLLVDDDENIRELYKMLLEGNFFDVTLAVDGQDGLEKLYQRVPDLVIVDYMMPRMDGRAFVQQLKSDQRTKQIPVLMFTAAPSEEREVELLTMGVDDFVRKTIPTQVLLARIKSALSRAFVG